MFDGRTHSFKTPLDKHIWLHEMAFKMKQAIDEDVKMTGKEMLRYALHKIAQVATSPGGNIIEFPAEIMMLDAKYNDWLYELPSQPTHWYLIFFVLMRAVRMWYTYNRFTTVREQRAEHHRIQKEIEKIQADESMNEQRKQEKIKELQAKDPTYVKRLLESTGLMNDKGQFIINIDSLKNLTSRIK